MLVTFTNKTENVDVVVIGGGPAGSTAATMLARKGWHVVLFESAYFPREHIGESLLPASLPILEELNVSASMESVGFLKKWGATMVWGKERDPWSWHFRETNANNPHSYQVDRSQFDDILLMNSLNNGVDVRQGHSVTQPLFKGDRISGVQYITDDMESRSINARLVVDASGQSVLLGRKLNLRRWDDFFRNLSVYGYFTGTESLPSPDESNIFIESYRHGWLWHIPLHTGVTSVGAVVDSKYGQSMIRKYGLPNALMAQISQAPHMKHMIRNASFVSGPFIAKDWSYVCERITGDGYVLIGDAACFVDPLFSSGVHLALMSGVLGAAYVNTTLKNPSMQEDVGQAYRDLYLREYGNFRELAQLFYSSNLTVDSYFWEARRILPEHDHYSPRHSFVRAVAGQSPLGYERVVLERGNAPSSFLHSVRSIEDERKHRRFRFEDSLSRENDRLGSTLLKSIPRLASDVAIETKPVVGEGEFIWSTVLISSMRPQGTPCSPFIATMIPLIDDIRTVHELMQKLLQKLEPPSSEQMQSICLDALKILYIDGVIEEFRGS